MIYWPRPFLTGESPQVTVYNITKEGRSLDEVSKDSKFLLVSYSVFIRGGSSYPIAELVLGRTRVDVNKWTVPCFPSELVCRTQSWGEHTP